MNPLHEFIFIASGITVIFTIVIIGLIVSNSKHKKRLKTSNEKEKLVDKVWREKVEKSNAELLKVIKIKNDYFNESESLKSQIKFKDDLIHGYKKDLKNAKDMENIWRTECDKRYQNHLDEQKKMQEAIDYLEELNGKSMSQVAQLNEANEAWKLKYNRVRYEKAESFKKRLINKQNLNKELSENNMKLFKQVGDLYDEKKQLSKLVDECAIYIMNNCK